MPDPTARTRIAIGLLDKPLVLARQASRAAPVAAPVPDRAGPPRAVVVLGSLLVTAVVQAGVRGQTQAWPFGCYPTFAHTLASTVPDVNLKLAYGKHEVRERTTKLPEPAELERATLVRAEYLSAPEHWGKPPVREQPLSELPLSLFREVAPKSGSPALRADR